MKNGFDIMSVDLNPGENKPAKKHQEELKKRAMDEAIDNPGRRKFFGDAGKFALAGLAFAAGVNTFNRKTEETRENSESEAEKSIGDLFNEKISSITDDLEYIKKELNLEKIEKDYQERLSRDVSDWEQELNSLVKQIKEEESEAALKIMFERIEELEKNISIERLGLENKFHLKA